MKKSSYLNKTKGFVGGMVTLGVGGAVVGALGGNTQPITTAGNMMGTVYAADMGMSIANDFVKNSKKRRK